jgi:hypothetical protein
LLAVETVLHTPTYMKAFAVFAVGFALSACTVGSSDPPDPSAEQTEEDLTTQQELKPFRDALQGISSRGSEGDPVAYRAIMITLQPGDVWNAETLAARIGPRISRIRQSGAVYGYQGYATGSRAMSAYWAQQTKPQDPADPIEVRRAAQMKALQKLCGEKLTRVTSMVVGVRSTPADASSIENGAVAPLIVGKLASGKLVVMYGIDIWT